jgi:hypothetical protein
VIRRKQPSAPAFVRAVMIVIVRVVVSRYVSVCLIVCVGHELLLRLCDGGRRSTHRTGRCRRFN